MRTQRQRADNPQPVRERFIAKGCDGEFLDELLTLWRLYCDSRRTKESVSTRKTFERLHARFIKLNSDIEQARTAPLNILSGRSVAEASPRRSSLALEAKNLKNDTDKIKRLDVRTDTRATVIKMMFVYCRDATHRNVTKEEVADLLEEATNHETTISAEAVRKAVDREMLSDDQEWAYAHKLAGAAMRRDKVWDFTRRKLRSSDANKT